MNYLNRNRLIYEIKGIMWKMEHRLCSMC